MTIAALAGDLMDRSKLSAAIPGLQFTLSDQTTVVIVDLARFANRIPEIRASHPKVRIIGYGPHVEDFSDVGADEVFARSKFFRDITAAVSD
jgi:hypothetical protein